MAKYSPNNIPDKHADWGRDNSDSLKRPFSGRAVQKFIKDALDGKVGYLHPDASNENYLLFSDVDNYNLYIQDPIGNAGLLIGTVPLASNYYVEIDLENTQTINYINNGATGNYIQAYFKVKNKGGAEISDDFNVTITIRNGSAVTTLHRNATYGTLFNLNVDEYLTEGTNIVTLSVASVTYGVGTSLSITYHSILLKVSDNLNISDVYGTENEVISVPVNIEGTGTKRIEWYIDGVQLAFDSQTDETSQTQTTLTRYISISALGEGRHNLQYRGVINLNGINFYSDTMYRDFIVYRGQTLNTIIVNAFSYRGANIIDPTDSPIDLGTVEQYVSKEIEYAIYNPNNVAVNALSITLGNKIETVNASNFNVYTYELKAFNYGSTSLAFELNNTEIEYNVSVEQSSLNLATIGNTEFEFEGNTRVNTSIDKRLENWSFVSQSGNTYHAQMSGFEYTERNGWTGEGLLIAEGASLLFDYAPLNYNIGQLGGTFEFEFETRRVLDDNQIICDLRTNGVGILITASEAKIVSQQGVELSAKYKSEEKNRIAFVVNQLNAAVNKGLIFVFINGILSGVKNYTVGDSFSSTSVLSFVGSADANILINQLRCYRRALRLDEILNNYILYRPTVDELLTLYDKNDILGNGTNLSLDKLSAQTPIIIITGNVEELQNFTKADKGTYRKMAKIEVINTDDPTRNLVLLNASMRCQGTSSMNYPKKNFRFYTQADGKDETVQSYITQMFDADGNELIGDDRLYSFKEGAQPVKTWCLKADYAESSSTHNTGTARLWNNVMKNAVINNVDNRYYRNTNTPCRTIAQQAAIDNEYQYDVRTTVDGFPIVLFYHLNESDPLVFLGKYNWNNDKSTESVFGFKDVPGFDNEHMECWEVVNGDYPENLFTDISNWDADVEYEGETMKGWQRAFEARYPDDSGKQSEVVRANGALKTFATWINGLKRASKVLNSEVVVDDAAVMATFSSEKWQHLDVYKIAAYYVYLMRFGGVDQTVKNAMFTTEDGLHWFYINYDNDTINGLDNNGALAFGYTIDRQTIDPRTGNSYCYAGHDSVLWNNLEADADFMAIVKIVDQALYNVGLTYANVINMYNNEQSKKWSERLHNLDSQFKYLDPWLNDNNSVGLPKLQGSRDTHRQWWLSNRFALYDAINVTGAYKSNVFLVRVSTVTLANPVHAYVTPARTGQIYGYGKGGVPVVAGEIGTVDIPIIMPISDQLYVGASLDFYNAVFAKKIDISAIAQYLTEVHLEAINSEAFDSSIEELILGTEISEINVNALTNLTNLGQAKYLKKLSICKFNGLTSIDLSSNKYFEELDARDCANLANVILPDAAPIKSLKFSSALQRLALKEVTTLQTLQLVNNGANITTIDLRSCQIDGFTNSPTKLFAWMNARGNTSGLVNVYVDNIDWGGIDPDDIIEFGQYVKSKGYLTLKGRCLVTNLTLEQVAALRETFGNNCFDADASLRFVGAGIFFVGSDDILSDGQYQYSVINATGAQGNITYTITQSASIQGLTINSQGLLTVPEVTGNDKTITIRATFVDTESGDIFNETMSITVRKRVYPANATIHGDTRIQTRHTYNWTTTTENINTNDKMYAEWTLSGTITNSVRIASQNLQSCILELFGSPINENGTLTLTLKKVSDDSTILTSTFGISAFNNSIAFTKETEPYLIEVMHSNYNSNGDLLCASADYMTKQECNAVVESDIHQRQTPGRSTSIFTNNSRFRSLQNTINFLQYFTGFDGKIPDYCFYGCSIKNLTIPSNITKIGREAFYEYITSGTSYGIINLIVEGNSLILNSHALVLTKPTNIVDNYSLNFDFDIIMDSNNGPCITYNEQNNANKINTLNVTFKYIEGNGELFDKVTQGGSSQGISRLLKLHVLNTGLINESYDDYVFFQPHDYGNTEIYLYSPITKNIDRFVEISTTNKVKIIFGENITNFNNLKDHFIHTTGNNNNLQEIYCNGLLDNNAKMPPYYVASNGANVAYYILNSNVVNSYGYANWNDDKVVKIVVKHSLLNDWKTQFPAIANKITDEFTAEGNHLDFTVTGDDVIGQAIGTILHVSKLYNGHYADGTSGQDYVVEDIEQEDNFFPQNETNAPVQRTFNVTLGGITKSCTITQDVINNDVIVAKYEAGNNVILYNNKNFSYTGIDGMYINGIKTKLNPKKDLSIDSIVLYTNATSLGYEYAETGQNLFGYTDIVECELPNTITQIYRYSFMGASSLVKVTLGNSVTNIRSDAFRICSLLTKLELPQTLDWLETECLAYSGLTELICNYNGNYNFAAGSGVLNGVPENGVLKIPTGKTNVYQQLINKLPSGWTIQEI